VKKCLDEIDKSAYTNPDIPRPGDVYRITEDVIAFGRDDTKTYIKGGTLLTFLGVVSGSMARGVWLVSGTGNIIEHLFLGEDMQLLKLVTRAK
jgi:hypothetical protein